MECINGKGYREGDTKYKGHLKDGKTTPFAEGFTDPRGLAVFQQWLFVADKDRVWRIDRNSGKATVLAGPVSNLARVLRAVAEKSRSGPADAAPAS